MDCMQIMSFPFREDLALKEQLAARGFVSDVTVKRKQEALLVAIIMLPYFVGIWLKKLNLMMFILCMSVLLSSTLILIITCERFEKEALCVACGHHKSIC